MPTKNPWQDITRFFAVHWRLEDPETGDETLCLLSEYFPDGTFDISGDLDLIHAADMPWQDVFETLTRGVRGPAGEMLIRFIEYNHQFIWDGALHEVGNELVEAFERRVEQAWNEYLET